MKSCFTFASDRRVHVLLCCSAAVLLSACGGGTPDAGVGQAQTAAVSSNGAITQSGAAVVAEVTSAEVTAETGAAGVVADAPADGAPRLLATSVSSTATCNYYIAPTGSDSGAGTLASPWKTVKYGSAKLTAGMTLCARGGTYYGQAGLIWKSSGTATAPVTFKNYPGEKPVFDGEWGDTGVDGDFLIFSNNSHVVVDGITAQHFVDQYGNGTIDLHNGVGPVDDITIQNSTLIDNGSHANQDHAIYIAAGVTNVTIRNNLLIRAAGSAIQAYHSPASSGIKIYNNVMIGGTLKCSQSKSNPCSASATQHWGLIIGDAKDTQIYNNTIYGMQYGMDFNYGTATTGPYIVKNNLIVNSTAAGIRVASAYAPYFTSDYNGFSGNAIDINWKGANMSAAQFAVSTTNERHAVSANPMFVDAAAGDFHLNAGSPVIDKGTAMTLFNTDKDGVARPSGLGVDMGAYEKSDTVVTAPPPPPATCNYYIAPNGSDSGAGTLTSPWKTVRYGSAKLTAGMTLCARGGTYYGQAGLIWQSSGTATAPVTFKNYPGEKPVFDGEWGDTGVEGDFLVFSNNSHVVVDGITVQRFADQYGNGAIDLHNGLGPVDDITIQNVTMIDNGSHTAQDHHIYIAAGATNVTIRNNLFIRAAGSAIQSYHSPVASGIKIYNNVMVGGTLKCSQSKNNYCSPTATQHWGVMISDAKGVQIYNNTIYGMQSGIEFNYGSVATTGPYTVKNNLIVNSTSAGIRVTAPYAPYYTSDYNGFSGNANDISWQGANMTATAFAVSTTNERHAVSANPMFVNAAYGDFHLNAGSPMIDKATAMTLFNYDKDGAARPTGLGFDIGAYEQH